MSVHNFYPNIGVLNLRVGCWKTEFMDIWISCIGSHEIDSTHKIFMPSVIKTVQPLTFFIMLNVHYFYFIRSLIFYNKVNPGTCRLWY